MTQPIITLTTDYGWGSASVAQLKGIIYGALPLVSIVDINHEASSGGSAALRLLLREIAFAFPLGTTHLVIVGSDTARRPLAVTARGMFFLGLDSGLLAEVLCEPHAVCVHIQRPSLSRQVNGSPSPGRDVLAPVAAELAMGLPICEVGEVVKDYVGEYCE